MGMSWVRVLTPSDDQNVSSSFMLLMKRRGKEGYLIAKAPFA